MTLKRKFGTPLDLSGATKFLRQRGDNVSFKHAVKSINGCATGATLVIAMSSEGTAVSVVDRFASYGFTATVFTSAMDAIVAAAGGNANSEATVLKYGVRELPHATTVGDLTLA